MGNFFGRKRGSSNSDLRADFSGGNVFVILTRENWDQKISEAAKEGKIVVANFSASWCGPCRMMAPVYTQLSLNNPHFVFLTVDVDELTDLSSSWNVHATPTFFFVKDGQQIDQLVGANKPELERKLLAFAASFERCM